MAKDRWGRELNTNAPDYIRASAQLQAERVEAEYGATAYGSRAYLTPEGAKQMDDYNTAVRMKKYYDDWSGLKYLSKEDEEKRRKQLEALRNDSAITSRYNVYSDLLDYGEAQINSASRYRSYDEWGQATGDQTYMGNLQSQLDTLQGQLEEAQQRIASGEGNTLNVLANEYKPLTQQIDEVKGKIANTQSAMTDPTVNYYSNRTLEQLQNDKQTLEKGIRSSQEEEAQRMLETGDFYQGNNLLKKDPNQQKRNDLEIINQVIAQKERENVYQSYADKMKANDFDGSYDSTNEDLIYQAVNGKWTGDNSGSHWYYEQEQFDEMTDTERQIFNSIYKNEGRAQALEFFDWLQTDLNARDRLNTEEAARVFARDNPVMASAASVMGKLITPLQVGFQVGHMIEGDLDQNAWYNSPSYVSNTLRNTVSNEIRSDSGEGLAWAYQAGMSVADNLAQMAVGGSWLYAGEEAAQSAINNVVLGLMGSSVFADSVVQGKDEGKSDFEIVFDATFRTAVEILTEKAGLDEVIKVSRDGGWQSLMRAVFAEGAEEGVSNISNLVYDNIKEIVKGNESEIRQEVDRLVAAGYSEAEAFAKVLSDKGKDLGLDVLSGAVSGLALSGGQMAFGKAAENVEPYIKQNLDDAVARGLSLGSDTSAYHYAEALEPSTNKAARALQKLHQIKLNNQTEVQLFKDAKNEYTKELKDVPVEEFRDKLEAISNQLVVDSESKEVKTEDSTEVKEITDSTRVQIKASALYTAAEEIYQAALTRETIKTNATTDTGTADQVDKILRFGELPTVQLSNGEIANLSDIDFGDNTELQSIFTNATLGLRKTLDANDYIADFKSLGGTVKADLFDRMWKTAYKMGANKASVANVKARLQGEIEAFTEVFSVDSQTLDNVIQHALDDGFNAAIKVTEATKTLVMEMAKATGQTVEFVEGLNDGNGNAVQGLYDEKTKKILISTTTRNPATVVFCHELTHAMKDSNKAAYDLYKEAILDKLSKDEKQGKFIREQVENAYPREANETEEEWKEKVEDEIVAIASENYLVEASFVNSLKNNKSLYRKVRSIVLSRYQRIGRDVVRDTMNRVSKQDADWFKKLSELWVDITTQADLDQAALEEYREALFDNELPNGELSDEAMEEVKEKVDDGEMITPQAETQFSREFDDDFMTKAEKRNLKEGIAAALIDEDTMKKAREIRANTKVLLEEYKRFLPEDKMGKNWKTKNGSYGMSGDLGTVCIRSLAVEPLMDFIADKIGHPLTAQETQFISQELMNYTHMPPCIYCYVAMDRNAKRDYLNRYINWREDTIKNFRSGMSETEVEEAFLRYDYKSGKRTMKETGALRDRFNAWKKMAFDPSAEKISKSDLTSTARAEEQKKVSAEYKKQINDAMRYAQSASYAKGVVGYTAYNNEILKWKQKRIDDLNSQYGLRMYSFTDYHPAFVLENMQIITDAAVRGLKVLAYTKEVDFARIFMRTGMNINISVTCQMKKAENGEFVEDGMMGADWKEAKKVREESNAFGGNVGITFVAFNDEQVEWACQQDWVDVVIPFHTVKAEEFVELNGFTNYKAVQEETKKSDFDKDIHKKEIVPEMHNNDFDTYKAALEANHLNAKFNEKWYQKWGVNGDETTQKWYMKLVNETRRSYNDTEPVQPIFNDVDIDWTDPDAEEQFKNSAVGRSIQSLDKPYGSPIGTSGEGHESLSIEWIAKQISDRMSKQTFSDSRLSRDFEDVGYHAGDLGKSEALSSQSGSRDTGHFGTGTYFVGNEEQINRHDYGKRPHEKVNFEKYNLFKPKNYSDASKLHQFMRRVDGWIGQYEGARSASEYNDYKEQLEDATYEFSDNGQQETIDDIDAWFFSDFESEERRSDSEIIDDVVRLARLTIGSSDLARVIADHSNRDVYANGDTLILNDGIYETEFTPEEYLKRVPRDTAENIMDWVSTEANDWRSNGLKRAESYEDWHDTIEDVSEILGVSADTLESAITDATEEADAISYPESTTADSIATRVMKRLGYEGVDVRHINDMDNTMYGSVIYDLKGEDLARKQEIGTARFSKEFDDEYMELAQDPEKNAVRLRELVKQAAEAAGYPTHLYHGTDTFGFTSVDLEATGADGFSFWASDNPDVSGSYTSNGYVRKISESNVDNDELLELTKQQIEDTVDNFRHLIDTTFSEWYFGRTDNSYIIDGLYAANPEAGYGDGVYDFLDEIVADAFYQYSDMDNRDFDEWQESSEGQAIYDVVAELEGLLSKYHEVESGDTVGGVYDLYANTDNFYTVDGRNKNWNNLSLPNIVDRTWIMFTDDNGEQRVQYSDNSGEEQDISYDEAREMLGWSLMDKLEVRWFEDDYGEISTKWDTENNKLGKPSKTRDLAAYARENGYDGVRFHNIHDNGKYGGNLASDVYAFFKPNEQVKSADPVTYDDNGNIIPLSERFKSDNEDIRYSKEFTDEETSTVDSEDIDRVADILGEVDSTRLHLTDLQVEKIAERLLRGTGSEYSKTQLAEDLKKAFKYWTKNKGTNYSALVRVMQDIMMPVVESIYDYSGDQMRRNSVIGKTFIISEETAKKAGINDINRRLLGYGVSFATDATKVKSDREVYNLTENWSNKIAEDEYEGVAEDLMLNRDITDEGEMVEAIYNALTTEREGARTQVVREAYRENFAFELAVKAYNEFIGESRVSWDDVTRRTNADVAKLTQQKLDEISGEYMNKMIDAMAKGDEIIKAEKNRLREKAEKAKQIDRLRKEWKRFDAYVHKPNKGRHFSPSYMKYLKDISDIVDLTSGKAQSKKNNALRELAADYKRLSELELYEDRAYDPTIEKRIEAVADMVDGRPIRKLSSSEIKQVIDVVRAFIFKATHQDEFINRAIGATVQEAARDTVGDIDSARGLSNKDSIFDAWLDKSLNPMRAFARFTDYHENDPLYKAADAIMRGEIEVNQYKMEMAMIFKEMQTGQFKRGSAEYERAKKYYDRYSKMNTKYTTVHLGGKDIEITEAQKLELIMHSRNEDNMIHILYGGLLVPNMKQLKKGHWNTAYIEGEFIVPTEQEMYRLSKNLDDFEKWFLDRSIYYFDTYAKKLINDTSLRVEGFARADVENYYPIRVVENHLNTKNYDVMTGMEDTGENIDSGMLKGRVKSKKPIYLNGIGQSLQRHQNFVSRYAALAVPLSDFNKIYFGQVRQEAPEFYDAIDKTLRQLKDKRIPAQQVIPDIRRGLAEQGMEQDQIDEAIAWADLDRFLDNRQNVLKQNVIDYLYKKANGKTVPVREAIEKKWGGHATKYIKNALEDLAGGRRVENSWLDKTRGNAAQAILTLNPSVSIKQAASFPTAIAELDYRSVARALVNPEGNSFILKRADQQLIGEYTAVLWGRMNGMSTQEIAELSLNQNKTAVNKALDAVPWLTNWIQKVDVATVGRLWYATQYWVDRHYKSAIDKGELIKGSDKYYETVARKFEDVVTKTQPNYSVFTRPDILRSKNGLVKAIMMFKTQPLQNFNIMYEAVSKYAAKSRHYKAVKGTGSKMEATIKAERSAAGHQMVRALTSQVLQTAVFTGMTFLANALILHRWDKYKDDEINEVTFAKVAEQLMWDYMASFFGNAFVGDWVEQTAEYFIRKFALDEDPQLRGISVFGIDTLNDMYELVDKIATAAADGDDTKAWKNVVKFAENIATIFGIPAGNVLKVFQSAWMYGQDIFEDYNITDLERDGVPVLFDFPDTTSTQYWNRVIRAYENGEDYKSLFNELIEKTTVTETDENGKEKTRIKATGALSKDDTSGVMEWVADLYVNGTSEQKKMVEGFLDKLYQYSNKPDYSIKQAKRRFYEYLDKPMPTELKNKDELTPAELEVREAQEKEQEEKELIAMVKTTVPQMSSTISRWSSTGNAGELPIEKGKDGCGAVMAWVYQNASDKEAVKRFAVEVMGYSQKAINTTAKEWEKKDLSDFK